MDSSSRRPNPAVQTASSPAPHAQPSPPPSADPASSGTPTTTCQTPATRSSPVTVPVKSVPWVTLSTWADASNAQPNNAKAATPAVPAHATVASLGTS